MYRLPKALPAVSLFHNPSSPHSRQVLNQLRASLSSPYPPSSTSSPLEFELEVVENKPTTEQLRTIRSYLNLPTTGDKSELQLEEPIVVNWNDGVASAGGAAPGEVLEALRRQRDEGTGEGKKDEGGSKGVFGWFKS
ncbi:hypothetical protein EXIGLDRAFT_755206 [Exidia glandulosa HHB12029]|uniref:Uncharacterized protein n=1 Tax=Exidia glandulosa HHB12029 TaxID=1314781 RepID=A0A165C9B0_EXIGL|nr:hypothetical protein EXIGLDRAFT_755206 [Exidia glandulosa HHB12029]